MKSWKQSHLNHKPNPNLVHNIRTETEKHEAKPVNLPRTVDHADNPFWDGTQWLTCLPMFDHLGMTAMYRYGWRFMSYQYHTGLALLKMSEEDRRTAPKELYTSTV